MRRPFRIVVIIVLASSAWAADVQLIAPIDKLPAKDTRRIERVLTKDFPTSLLRKRAGGKGKLAISRVTYFPLRQSGKQYVLSVSCGRWNNYASRFTVYRIYRDSITRVYTSRSWQGNYPCYSFDAVQAGKETIVLFKEGVEDESTYALASVLAIGRGKNGLYIRDITPALPGLTVKVEFPFKPLYAKAVRLLPEDEGILTASDNFTPDSRWNFDKVRRKLVSATKPTVISSSSDPLREH